MGPKGQFFAYSNQGYRWHGFGNDFQEGMQEMMAGEGGWKPEWEPDRVLFGVGDSWLLTCKGGKQIKFNKSFRDRYAGLYTELIKHFNDRSTACGVRGSAGTSARQTHQLTIR